MVIQMNKTGFIEAISKEANISKEEAILVSNVLDETFFISKSKKEETINGIIDALNIKYDKAESIYNTCISIFKREIKNKIKHPFKSH